MNILTLLFGVLLCLVVVNARRFEDRNIRELLENEEETLKIINEHTPQARHRKRRWQSNYGYDYPPPGYYYPERRDYERNNQEVLHQISRLLEEISAYIRRPPPPPPPPQHIYIPYPVAFSQIPSVPCVPANRSQNVSVPNRGNFPPIDPNQNWGLEVENDYDDGSDGSRPISFEPIVPKTIMKRPPPPVEHGSVQASVPVKHVTEAPIFAQSQSQAPRSVSLPGMCNAAILSCCKMFDDNVQQQQCFINIGCSSAYSNGNPCSNESFKKALNSFTQAYAPVK